MRFAWRELAASLLLLLSLTSFGWAEDGASAPAWPGEPIRSMGQPAIWRKYGGAYYSSKGQAPSGGTAAYFGLYKDLLPSVAGIGVSGEAYALGSRDGSAVGFRALADLRGLMVKTGLDYSARTGSANWILSFNAPLRRGGILGRGSYLRVDWIPGRGNAWQVGVLLPFESHMGRTRPRDTEVDLPPHPPPPPPLPPRAAAIGVALGNVRVAARWIFQLTHVFWDDSREDRVKSLERTRQEIAQFKNRIATRDTLRPEGVSLAGEVSLLHSEMARAFALATGDAAQGARLHCLARAAMAEEVVLPYNRLFGQWKRRDSLLAFGATARIRFLAEVQTTGIRGSRSEEVAGIFDGYLRAMDEARAMWRVRQGDDSRLVFLPLQLVLQPWEHDSQEEIDALIGRAIKTPFTRGNSADYLTGRQFQPELLRSIHEARDYHVLWLHDFNGVNATGDVDRVGFAQAVDGYLAALTDRVREFDVTQRLPVFLILLDHNAYDITRGRLFMDLLEDPLGHRFELPRRAHDLQQRAQHAQDALRLAVNQSVALQAQAARRGKGWLRKLVKVHVSITNPVDFSYRTSRLAYRLPIAPDTVIRDHRKIAFRDVTEADPGRGEALYAGVAVGEQYASATWEDRAMRATGPALLTLKDAARRYLTQNGFAEKDIPSSLQPLPRPAGYDEEVARLEAAGALTTALDVHNDLGFARKNASLVISMLYTLMPPGSLIVVPSSIWTDPVWAGQLVAAALRGCNVYVIAPARDNAPQSSFVTIARSREVFSRFFEIQRQLAPEIEAASGHLRTGLFNRRAAADETQEWLREILEGYRRYPFLADEFPLAPSFFEVLLHGPQLPAPSTPYDLFPFRQGPKRPQQLHRKTQFLATRASLRSLTEVVATEQSLRGPFFRAVRGEPLGLEERILLAAEDTWLGGELAQAHRRLPDETKASSVYYLTIGSMNTDTRGHVLDGEVLYVVAGDSSLAAYTDFAALVGCTTWIASQEELDGLLPPVTHLKRKISRWVRKAV